MKNLLVLGLIIIAVGFIACTNKKAEEAEAKLKAMEDSIKLAHYNDSVAEAEAWALHVQDSINQAWKDSVELAAKKAAATTTKKNTTTTTTKPDVNTIRDRNTDQNQVTPAENTIKGRRG